SKFRIKIQQIRFPNKFEVLYDVSPDVLHCKILKFLIQPIIENSFYHGLEPKGGQGLLKLTIGQRGQLLYICVYDNGVGIKEEKLKELTAMLQQNKHTLEEDTGRNFGLRNVHARIKHFYGNDYRMEITSNDQEGTSISIHLPINRELSSDENFGGR
ncbi:ATP-binding protein, partial [Paenibacillus cisolokensis]|uniref:sensor histidine kinase n=1 Tax=Paenibacillus cisolokensis TaxID=1658519 RepID=UPI003D2AC6A6